MHIPDGFLETKVWAAFDVISAGFVGFSLKIISKKIDAEKRIPMIGVISAFTFAAQMLNFPVAGGTSGHFMGSTLAAILLGPFTSTIIMTVVLIVQSLVFQDGGILALGANIFNMGIVGAFVGWFFYKIITNLFKGKNGVLLGSFIGAWFAIVIASASCAIQLGISNTVPLKVSLISMVSVHALIGIGEGIITLLVLLFIMRTRKDLLDIEKF
uniref:Cobalamin biosynthesis protein CbiM n=1 Tax=candidate division WOR-3 bacterium TaxID=2052148 RepID=A0A7C4U830_UNCW3